MDTTIPRTLQVIFSHFVPVLTTPSFENFRTMMLVWIQCSGRHTISRVIQAAGPRGREKHFSTLYRFFSRAVWAADAVGRVVFDLVVAHVPGARLLMIVDFRSHLSRWQTISGTRRSAKRLVAPQKKEPRKTKNRPAPKPKANAASTPSSTQSPSPWPPTQSFVYGIFNTATHKPT